MAQVLYKGMLYDDQDEAYRSQLALDRQIQTINGRQYHFSDDQSIDPNAPWAAEVAAQRIQGPDGRWGIPLELANSIGERSNQNDFIGNFLNGPGPVMGLIGAGLGLTAFGPQGLNLFGGGNPLSGGSEALETVGAGGDAALSGADSLANFQNLLEQQGITGPGGGMSQMFQNLEAAGAGGAGTAASTIGRLLSGQGTASDYAQILGTLGATGLGVLGSNAQQNALSDVANQYLAMGAPYRDQLAASYQPGFDLASQPGYGDAFNKAADISARTYSSQFGNPADSSTAQAGILKDVWSQTYLPALSNYRGGLMQAGGLGLNTSGTASLAGAGNTADAYNAVGFGLGSLTTPQNDLESTLRRLQQGGLLGGSNYRLNLGGPV